ncbi:protein yifE [Klebsiella pneumoniae]|uniref:Protein yifE n=1 Tax=Klebsiella pneumoniae TaxID=573 RepID=A0A2X3CU50_KLEPN|nr:protein yifE [Klebsiella pneumoniae]
MAESFTTTNRFFDNKNYPRGFSVTVISPSKRRNCWNVMVMPLTNWNWVSANCYRR